MNKINSLIGKLVFGLAVVSVLFKEKILPSSFDVGDCINVLLIGFSCMIIGFILEDIQRVRNKKLEEEQRKKWINSLYRKE
jgi:hypothetical protein